MIVGDCRVFAIESTIREAVESLSQLALGSFVIHVGGRSFGVQKSDATMLGCSFNEVGKRVQRRGKHLFPLLDDFSAGEIAGAYLDAVYRDGLRTDYFGLSQQEFVDRLIASGAIWAPDGDAAFDDGSHILQFDMGSRVRIIAFFNRESPGDLSLPIVEEWMDANLFYAIASDWLTLFETERASALQACSRSTI